MNIVKVGSRTPLEPATLVEVLEDESTTWGVYESIDKKRLVALSLPHYDQRFLFNLAAESAWKVNVEDKTVRLDKHRRVGATRHTDQIIQEAYLDGGVPTIIELLNQFREVGYRLIE